MPVELDSTRNKGRTISRDLRVNQMIRIPQVRVVDEEGAQLGVMPTPQALEMAQERGFDLVEVAPMASPPVVKFLDFGQYKYELTKREKEAKRKQRSVTFKEVRLSPKIGVGDFDTKVHRAIEFLEDGDRIKVTVRFRGRELTHPEIGRNLIARFVGPGQGSRGRGTDAAARRQVDAHHDGIDPQAQGPRRPGPTRDGADGHADGAPAPTPNRRRPHRPTAAATETAPPAPAAPAAGPKTEPKTEPQTAEDRTEDRTGRRGQAEAAARSRRRQAGGHRQAGSRQASRRGGRARPGGDEERQRTGARSRSRQESEATVPKMKSHKAAQKRIGVTGSGKSSASRPGAATTSRSSRPAGPAATPARP